MTTVLPRDTDLASALDFHSGGKLPPPPISEWVSVEGGIAIPIPNTKSFLVDAISGFFTSGTGNLAVFENSLASANDPIISETSSRVLTFRGEVYHLLTPEEANPEKIVEAVDDAYSGPVFIGILSSVPASSLVRLETTQELSGYLLDSIAGNVSKLVIGAYDGEGFLLWHRE